LSVSESHAHIAVGCNYLEMVFHCNDNIGFVVDAEEATALWPKWGQLDRNKNLRRIHNNNLFIFLKIETLLIHS
jgi:hypothetical protein